MTGRALHRETTLVLFAAVLLAGCGSGERLEQDGLTVLVAEASSGGADALLAGRLEDVGGCLGIAGMVVVWPHGTQVSGGDPVTITVPGQPAVGLGSTAEVGGGVLFESREHEAEDYSVAGVTIPASCVVEGVWIAGPVG